jgi:hypothetical protein
VIELTIPEIVKHIGPVPHQCTIRLRLDRAEFRKHEVYRSSAIFGLDDVRKFKMSTEFVELLVSQLKKITPKPHQQAPDWNTVKKSLLSKRADRI